MIASLPSDIEVLDRLDEMPTGATLKDIFGQSAVLVSRPGCVKVMEGLIRDGLVVCERGAYRKAEESPLKPQPVDIPLTQIETREEEPFPEVTLKQPGPTTEHVFPMEGLGKTRTEAAADESVPLRERILALLSDGEAYSKQKLIDETKSTLYLVNKTLTELATQGLITVTRGWGAKLVSPGERLEPVKLPDPPAVRAEPSTNPVLHEVARETLVKIRDIALDQILKFARQVGGTAADPLIRMFEEADEGLTKFDELAREYTA